MGIVEAGRLLEQTGKLPVLKVTEISRRFVPDCKSVVYADEGDERGAVSHRRDQMKVTDVEREATWIVSAAGKFGCDPEGLHSCEDDLYRAVLTAIAMGTCDDPKACAAAALKTQNADFPRW
jgi:hypothetical protein